MPDEISTDDNQSVNEADETQDAPEVGETAEAEADGEPESAESVAEAEPVAEEAPYKALSALALTGFALYLIFGNTICR